MPRRLAGWQEELPSGRIRCGLRIDGKVVRRTFKDDRAARAWRREMGRKKVRVEAGVESDSEDVTYARVAPVLRARWRAPGRHTAKVIVGYESQLRRLLETWGERRIAETRPAHVRAWEAELAAEGLSASTIRHYLDRLSQLHKVAVEEGWLRAVPCPVSRPRLVQRTVRSALPEEELEAVLEAARTDWDRRAPAVVLLAADAGLARLEIVNLHTEDVILEDDPGGRCYGWLRVEVRSETERPKHDRGTGGEGRARVVPILTLRLRQALDDVPRLPGRFLGLRSADGVVGVVSRAWRRALDRTPELHRLRHRFVTRALENPALPPELVRRWAGHKHLRTTQGYSSVDPRSIPAGAGDFFQNCSTGAPRRGADEQGKSGTTGRRGDRAVEGGGLENGSTPVTGHDDSRHSA